MLERSESRKANRRAIACRTQPNPRSGEVQPIVRSRRVSDSKAQSRAQFALSRPVEGTATSLQRASSMKTVVLRTFTLTVS